MRKIFLVLFCTTLLFAGIVKAQSNTLPDPGILPDSPVYFLKIWGEKISTFFTFEELKKAEKYTQLAEKRVAEMERLIEKGKTKQAEKIAQQYEKHLNRALEKVEKAKEEGQDTQALIERVETMTSKHIFVLQEVLQKAPEQAKAGLQKAIDASQNGSQRAIRALEKKIESPPGQKK